MNNINDFIDKMISFERRLSAARGDFSFFALFLREDAEDKWDLIVSAPWLDKNTTDGLKHLGSMLQLYVFDYVQSISRIIWVEGKAPELEAIHRSIETEHSIVEVKDSTFFGLPIKHAYIITSKKINEIPKTRTAAS